MFHRPSSASPAAFTLVELLAVVAIIGILAAITLPVVASCRAHAAKTTELFAARQLMTGYHLYASENRGRLLPFQEAGATATTQGGAAIGGITGSRWPHRLRPYLGDRFQAALYVNAQASYYSETAFNDDYTLSLRPTFGMNGSFVGGDSSSSAIVTVPPVRSVAQADNPAGLVVFASAHDRTVSENSGYWRISSPRTSFPAGAPDWPVAESTGPAADPTQDRTYGYVAFRWNAKAVVAFLDGHVALHSSADLRDMRLWSDAARRENNADYRPH